MPFKSKEQERYLQINEPEIYQDWVEKYGRFKEAESFGAEAIPIRHSRRPNGYYAIKGYEDASEDGFIYRIYRAPDTNDWFKATVYDDNAMKDNFRKPTSRRLNPSGEMVISNDPPSLLIGAFPKLEDAKRALVFRMIQDGNYHRMMSDGNLKWLLKDYYAESFSAEGDYEPSFDSLEERIEWMEFAVNDKFLHQYEDDYSNVVLDIEEWNESNGNNFKLSNLVKQYKNKTDWMDAESFGAEVLSIVNPSGRSENDDPRKLYVSIGFRDGEIYRGYVELDSEYEMDEEGYERKKAESFNSYKVAPDLSSYTKAELVSSIAGPQGTAAYDEVVYDPLAQSRLSAESIDSFSPARLIVLGVSIGVALGLYNTRRD